MSVLTDRPDLPTAARWTVLGGFLIEVGGLATPAQLSSSSTVPADLGVATLAQFALGLIVAFCGASAFVVPWTQIQRFIGGIAAWVSLLFALFELEWGGTLALVTLLGAGTAIVATWPWAGRVTGGPGSRARRGC